MATRKLNRRRFCQASAATLAAAGLAAGSSTLGADEGAGNKKDRPRVGAIGLRYQGSVIARKAAAYGDIVALCDVDSDVAAKARQEFGDQAMVYEDYRALLDRKDLDVVLIGTPDHWHTPMLLDACRAGKDVYCEKPLTLTIDEGRHIVRVVNETQRVVQVGSWQRSDSRFRLAAEMIRAGRIGRVRKITVVLGKNEQGGPFPVVQPPAHFNWNLWQGQTAATPYIAERSHYTFRWWYEYSGGQMTDWGAHHVDIAQWMLGHDQSGPVEIDGQSTFPQVADGYNVAKDFQVSYVYADGAELEVLDNGRNGILAEGDAGRLFVNRGAISGTPVDQLTELPLPRDKFQLYADDNRSRPERAGKLDAIINHMGNFFDCIQTRRAPISDVASQHRSVTTCHLANISMRLGRKLKWDPAAQRFVGDDEANRWLSRPQREGFKFNT